VTDRRASVPGGSMKHAMEEDFRGWVSARRSTLRSTAFLLSGDWHLAEDLAQETLARMFAVWPRVASTGSPDAYARRVLVNLYLDHRRRPWRREQPLEVVPEPPPETPSGADGTRVELIAALREVPPGQRAVLVLRFWEDLSVEQTAAALGTSQGNVKSQTSRGLDALRAALARRGLDRNFAPATGETS
jgi:RNA polymerase sigma-70 factor (sigma-E family)